MLVLFQLSKMKKILIATVLVAVEAVDPVDAVNPEEYPEDKAFPSMQRLRKELEDLEKESSKLAELIMQTADGDISPETKQEIEKLAPSVYIPFSLDKKSGQSRRSKWLKSSQQKIRDWLK